MSQQKLAHYQIKELLGEGSFAWVYRAYDEKFEQDVALKMLKPMWLGDPQAVDRFKQEARTMRKLHHQNIVNVFDIGQAESQVYLSQRLIEGETLAQRLTQGPLAWETMLKIVQDIASALDYAHDQGIVHRDIKPSNILLDETDQVFLGDFGLMRAVDGSASLSASASMVGTGHYMAPELWDGQAATTATDVYALSCVVFEMLMGQVLFEGSSMAAVVRKHVVDGPQFPETWPAGVPAGVRDILKAGLTKDPAKRTSNPGELVASLVSLTAKLTPKPEIRVSEAKTPAPKPETSESKPDTLTITKPFKMEFIRIPAGEFLMGSDPAKDEYAQNEEQPQHKVTLPDYYIGKYPVTNAQFAAYVKATGYKKWSKQGGKNNPAVNVSWHDAVAFCHWLTQESGHPIRLPTEAEWEKAARGTDGRIYPWGNTFDKTKLNSIEGGPRSTTPVGRYSPGGDSPYGVVDMAGNVWEWCSTIWADKAYPFRIEDEWTGTDLNRTDVLRVLRGGSWEDYDNDARCAFRGRADPFVRDDVGGFRVMVSPI